MKRIHMVIFTLIILVVIFNFSSILLLTQQISVRYFYLYRNSLYNRHLSDYLALKTEPLSFHISFFQECL